MIDYIEVSGTNLEMGRSFGEAFRDKIHEFYNTRMQRIKNFEEKYGHVKVTDKEILDAASNCLKTHENYDGDIWQEFLGISEGANLEPKKLFTMMNYTDLRDYIYSLYGVLDHNTPVEGCSAFLLPKDMSKTNSVVFGQTWDMSAEAINYIVIVKRKPKNGPETLYLTTYGCLALIGMNSEGIAVGTTNLMASDSEVGIGYLFTLSRALKHSSIKKAADEIKSSNRLSGHSFFLASKNEGIKLETTSLKYKEKILRDIPLVHTNHYQDSELQQYEIPTKIDRHLNSVYRHGRLLSRLAYKESFDLADCWDILSDNKRNATFGTICNEDYTGQYSEFATAATVLADLDKRQLIACRGGAKTGQKEIFAL